MRAAWIGWGGAAPAAVLTLLLGGPLKAADETGVHYVAEELGDRAKTPEASDGAAKDKLSDSAVRVMSTFALSILPDQLPSKSGEMIKLDKSDPSKYLIPLDDARRVAKLKTGLRRAKDVTEAVYDAGFGSSSRVYERADTRLGRDATGTAGRGHQVVPGDWVLPGHQGRAARLARLAPAHRPRAFAGRRRPRTDGRMIRGDAPWP